MTTMMVPTASGCLLKIESLRSRAKRLTSLRKMLDLKSHQDIRQEQWEVIESQLAAVSNKVQLQLKLYTDKYLADYHDPKIRSLLVNRLGELEMELTEAYVFYDTFMDILTQRLSDVLGPLLAGCDVIAADGLQRSFLADITAPPLVYCERHYGASTLREGVRLAAHAPNPLPFIAIPYARIEEKYNLISIYHEVGHQALAKLNLVKTMQKVFSEATAKAGAAPMLQGLFANWSKELVPDFWAFALTGMAHTSSIRDVLMLPQQYMFQVSPNQQHPPPFLRFLASVEWCRALWGRGDWDGWAEAWCADFPMHQLDNITKDTIRAARKLLPVVANTLLHTRFRKLGNKPLLSLFDIDAVHPQRLKPLANKESLTSAAFQRLPIGTQLAAFRLFRDKRIMKINELDTLMNQWISQLPNQFLTLKK